MCMLEHALHAWMHVHTCTPSCVWHVHGMCTQAREELLRLMRLCMHMHMHTCIPHVYGTCMACAHRRARSCCGSCASASWPVQRHSLADCMLMNADEGCGSCASASWPVQRHS